MRHERKLTREATELANDRTELVDAEVLVERTENRCGLDDMIVNLYVCGGFRDVL